MAIVVAASVLAETASATSLACNVPTGTTSGDLLVAVMTQGVTGPVPDQTGWTLVAKASQGTTPTGMWYRWGTASEPASYTFTASALGRITVSLHRLAGVDATTPLDVAAVTAVSGATLTLTIPSITTVTADALVLYDASVQTTAATVTPPASVTTITNTNGVDGRRQLVGSELYAAAGATGARAFTISSSLPVAGIGAAFRPATETTPTLTHTVVGVPTGTEARVATRTTSATSVRLQVSTSATFASGIVSGAAVTPNAQGDSQLTVGGLTAGTAYYYRVGMTVSGTETFSAISANTFKTAPTGQASFAFCFASCADGDSAAMSAIAARGDDFFLHLGDAYYADASGTGVANFRTKMVTALQATNHQSVYKRIPSARTPSDHDGMNNGSNAGTDATAWTNWNSVTRELFPLTAGAPATTGVYDTFVWGRVRFIVLDRRSFATIPSATDDATKTSLGATQKQWLKDTITNIAEKAIVIVQDAPWIGSAAAGDDGWFGYTTERTELANFFSASGKAVHMLAGDMHAVAADDGTNAPGGIAVFHGAPLNKSASQKGGPYTVGPSPASGTAVVQQYGRIVVTDSGSSISLAFTGYDSANTALVTLTETVNMPATPTAIADSSAVYAPAVSTTVTAAPAAIADGSAVYAPAASTNVTTSPVAIADTSALYAPTATVAGTGLGRSALGTSPLGGGASPDVVPDPIPDTSAAYAPAVTGAVTVAPNIIADTSAVYAPAVGAATTATPGTITDGSTVATPAVTTTVATAPTPIADNSALYAPVITVQGGPITAVPSAVADSSAIFAPAAAAAVTVGPGHVATIATAYGPVVVPTVTLGPASIGDGSALYAPAASGAAASPTRDITIAVGKPTARTTSGSLTARTLTGRLED